MNFTLQVIGAFEIGPYRIGLIQYSTGAVTEFDLDDYSTKEQLQSAVNGIVYQSGWTNTHLALATLTDRAFLTNNGGRGGSIPRVWSLTYQCLFVFVYLCVGICIGMYIHVLTGVFPCVYVCVCVCVSGIRYFNNTGIHRLMTLIGYDLHRPYV